MLGKSLAPTLVLSALLVAGCSGGKPSAGSPTTTGGQTTTNAAQDPATIRLRGAASSTGPWKRHLSAKLGTGGNPGKFFVCGVWSHTPPKDPCRAPAGTVLPAGATMRLEQRPIGPAVERPDSPGWGLVGTSGEADLDIPLSSFVSGDRPGPVTYRVTLRDGAGRVLATSNPITITWQK